jgi:hypothetical protein
MDLHELRGLLQQYGDEMHSVPRSVVYCHAARVAWDEWARQECRLDSPVPTLGWDEHRLRKIQALAYHRLLWIVARTMILDETGLDILNPRDIARLSEDQLRHALDWGDGMMDSSALIDLEALLGWGDSGANVDGAVDSDEQEDSNVR